MIELVNLLCQPTTGLFERNTLCHFFIGDCPICCFCGNAIFCGWFINHRSFRFFYRIIFCHIKVFLQGKDTYFFNTSIVFLLKFQRSFFINYSIGRAFDKGDFGKAVPGLFPHSARSPSRIPPKPVRASISVARGRSRSRAPNPVRGSLSVAVGDAAAPTTPYGVAHP